MTFEYKTVGAPEKGKRKRGARSRSDRVAAAFEEILEAEAVDGWEYMRTDLVPVIERLGLFGRSQEVHRAVMVFRRSQDRAEVPRDLSPFDAEARRAPSVLPPRAPAEPSPPVSVQPRAAAPRAAGPAVGEEADLLLAQQRRAPSGPSGRR